MNGVNGHMGQVITQITQKDPEIELAAGIDPFDGIKNPFPVFPTLDQCDVPADVVIDFSNASGIDRLLDDCVKKKLPLVLCTTGLSDSTLDHVQKASENIAVLRSANMSLGINTLMDLLKKATAVFADAGYDIEIIEQHHNQKLDAPSGTAIALADAVNEAHGGDYDYVYDRSHRREKRNAREIGISSVRGGNIVGIHEVLFCGEDEVITFRHQATSKSVFAKGAVEAAKFLADAPAGMYDMSDVIAAK